MSHAEDKEIGEEVGQVAAFFRALTVRAERDPRLAASLAECLRESGLLSQAGVETAATEKRAAQRTRKRAEPVAGGARLETLDPFTLWRTRGEAALRFALDGLELGDLRAVVRAHRLDPARISSRWTARERVISLIMEQVKARLNHGRAFERV